ncbi:MAG: hypothetical protein K2W95_09855 [Candidatus Obscuribacterales bacterium]|nr:hypothetical protein [Candidatus Obscuribacterales bacterium]
MYRKRTRIRSLVVALATTITLCSSNYAALAIGQQSVSRPQQHSTPNRSSAEGSGIGAHPTFGWSNQSAATPSSGSHPTAGVITHIMFVGDDDSARTVTGQQDATANKEDDAASSPRERRNKSAKSAKVDGSAKKDSQAIATSLAATATQSSAQNSVSTSGNDTPTDMNASTKKSEEDSSPQPTPQQRAECEDVISKNFSDWIKLAGGTGDKISLRDIGKLLEKPDLPAKQAAAVAAIAHYFYALEGEHDVNHIYTLSSKEILKAIEDPSSQGKQGKYAVQLVLNFHTGYENVREDTHKDGWSLWGDHNPPILSENVQWKLNDCYVISAINGIIKNDPGALERMIKQTGPDTFVVRFPGYTEPVKVQLTPGEVAAFSYSRHGGCYLAVLGMAVVKVMEATGTDKNPAAAMTPLGAITDTHTFGWVQKNTFHLLTGKDFVQIQLKNYSPTQWKEFIENALTNHELIGTDYAQDQHFLTIIGLKNVDGQLSVVIKNPWGNERPFEGHEGKFGVFTIPLVDMVSTKFGSITIEKSNFDKVTMVQEQGNSTATTSDAQAKETETNKSDIAGKSSQDTVPAVDTSSASVLPGADNDVMKLKMVQGSSFVAHNKSVSISTAAGEVQIAPRAVAYIVQIGKDVAVYNLCAPHAGDVKVSLPSNQVFPVQEGHELLLSTNTNSSASFRDANLRPGISCSKAESKGVQGGLTIFDAQFSINDALTDAPGFSALVNSPDKNLKAIANRILKTAAAFADSGN